MERRRSKLSVTHETVPMRQANSVDGHPAAAAAFADKDSSSSPETTSAAAAAHAAMNPSRHHHQSSGSNGHATELLALDNLDVKGATVVHRHLDTTADGDDVASILSDDSDSHHHHAVPRKGSSFGAFFNIICVVVGTGCLQLPYALMLSGWLGIVLIVLSGFIGYFSGDVLIRCLYHDPKRRLPGFTAVGEAAFGKWGKAITVPFLYTYCLGSVCVYIILAGETIHSLVLPLKVDLGRRAWMAISAALMWLPFVLIKAMSEVAVLSIFGYVSSLVVVLVAVIEGARDYDAVRIRTPDPITHSVLSIGGVPLALASISFAYAGNVVYPHVEASMKKPQQWRKVLACGMLVVSVMYLCIAIGGYAVYGNITQSPILNSIPNNVPAKIAFILITAHVILAAPLLLTSFAVEAEMLIGINLKKLRTPRREFIARFTFRTLVTAALLGISMVVPFFADVLSLVGALSTTLIFFILPIACYLKLFGWRNISWVRRIICVVILVIGMIGCVLGTIDAVKQLVRHVKAGYDPSASSGIKH
ncbi:hypothetical protein GQ42DRAFT_162301 [Ramicandelaber brevisporus]|nr:hypothetical protein GQ42DRAFT_162301 [Ramicandelaber brevisporus]